MRHLRFAQPFMIVCLVLMHTRCLYPDESNMTISVELGRLTGHTTYWIGGRVDQPGQRYDTRFPVSELKFPTDLYTATLQAGYRFRERIHARLSLTKSLTQCAGKMRDSDWGVNSEDIGGWPRTDTLDVVSETDARLDKWMTEMNLRVLLFDENQELSDMIDSRTEVRWRFYGGIGHRYQKLDFTVHDVEQWYPSLNDFYGMDMGRDRAQGLAGTYEVVFHIPYLECSAWMDVNRSFTIDARLAYSPYAWTRDHDGHLLREPPIFAKGRCNGDAVMLNASAAYRFAGNWRIFTGMDYMKIETRGRQRNYRNKTWIWTTDELITSEQIRWDIGISLNIH